MINMAEDVSDEEYLDDPIRLFDFEQSRVYYREPKGDFQDLEETLDFNDDDIECMNTQSSKGTPQSILPATFFDIDRNVELLSQCCPLSIRLIDCNRYPSIFKRKKKSKMNDNNTSEKVMYYDKIDTCDTNVKTDKSKEINTIKLEVELFENCDVKRLPGNNITSDRHSYKNVFKESKLLVDNRDNYSRTIAEAYHTVKRMKKSNSTINTCEQQCSNSVSVALTSENDIYFNRNTQTKENISIEVQTSKLKPKPQRKQLTSNLKKHTKQMKNSHLPKILKINTRKNKEKFEIVSKDIVTGRDTNNKNYLVETKHQEASGLSSPILPCPMSMGSFKQTSPDLMLSKVSHKRSNVGIQLFHRRTCSNNCMPNKDIICVDSETNIKMEVVATPFLSRNIIQDNRDNIYLNNGNVSKFNHVSMNIPQMPCCLKNALLQHAMGGICMNDGNSSKRQQESMMTIVEENITRKKPLRNVSVNGISEKVPISNLSKEKPLNEIDRYIQSVPIKTLKTKIFENESSKVYSEYIDLITKKNKNTEIQQSLLPDINSNTTSLLNMGKKFKRRENYSTDNLTAYVVKPINNELNVNDKIYIHDILEGIQKAPIECNEIQILDKYPVLVQQLQKPTTENNYSNLTMKNDKLSDQNNFQVNECTNLSNKGYSPAILPIPTYHNTFKTLAKLQTNYLKNNPGHQNLDELVQESV